VVVVGGGFGGATAARYLRLWGGNVDVTLVERNAQFISCPISNLVLGGHKQMADITRGYEACAGRGRQGGAGRGGGGRRRRQEGAPGRRRELAYDRLVMSPGIDFMFDEQVGGLRPRSTAAACCTPGRPARRRWRCAASSRPCPTAAWSR
jgi:sulfide dehydrogenase [flavocytochrome c] flavoprotein subunit